MTKAKEEEEAPSPETSARPYECPIADCRFTNRLSYEVKRHLNGCHLFQYYLCSYCNFKSIQPAAVIAHMAKPPSKRYPGHPKVLLTKDKLKTRFDSRHWLWKVWNHMCTAPVFVNGVDGDAEMLDKSTQVIWECLAGSRTIRARESGAAAANCASRGPAPATSESRAPPVPTLVSVLSAETVEEIAAADQSEAQAFNSGKGDDAYTPSSDASVVSPVSSLDGTTPLIDSMIFTDVVEPSDLLSTLGVIQSPTVAAADVYTWVPPINPPMNYAPLYQGSSLAPHMPDLAHHWHHAVTHDHYFPQAGTMPGSAPYPHQNVNVTAMRTLNVQEVNPFVLGSSVSPVAATPFWTHTMTPALGLSSLDASLAFPVDMSLCFAGQVQPVNSLASFNRIGQSGTYASGAIWDHQGRQQEQCLHSINDQGAPWPTRVADGLVAMGDTGSPENRAILHGAIYQPDGVHGTYLPAVPSPDVSGVEDLFQFSVPNTLVPYVDAAGLLPFSHNADVGRSQHFNVAGPTMNPSLFETATSGIWPRLNEVSVDQIDANVIELQLNSAILAARSGAQNAGDIASTLGTHQLTHPSAVTGVIGAFDPDTSMYSDDSMRSRMPSIF